ncbi:hypothetical protein pb186bvf_008140 [Paramecium bursaria]
MQLQYIQRIQMFINILHKILHTNTYIGYKQTNVKIINYYLKQKILRHEIDILSNFMYFSISLNLYEWPGSVCKFEKCQAAYMGNFDNRRWNVHGLWPNTVLATSCGQISNCRAETYDQSKLNSATLNLVNLTWNGLYSDTVAFRKHEWEKHGTCYPGSITQNSYFSLVGNLNNQYNYWQILANAGIYPDNGRVLKATDLNNAFSSVLGGASFTYQCAKDSASGLFYLAELRICFNQSLQIRTCDCKNGGTSAFVTCGASFYYPTFSL